MVYRCFVLQQFLFNVTWSQEARFASSTIFDGETCFALLCPVQRRPAARVWRKLSYCWVHWFLASADPLAHPVLTAVMRLVGRRYSSPDVQRRIRLLPFEVPFGSRSRYPPLVSALCRAYSLRPALCASACALRAAPVPGQAFPAPSGSFAGSSQQQPLFTTGQGG